MREKMKLFGRSLVILTLVFVSAQSRDMPPTIDKTEFLKIPSPQYFESGAEVILACTAEGHPTPTYTWYKDDQLITSSYIQQDPITGELRIGSLTSRETGKFRCYAENNIGGKTIKSMSPIMEIKLAFMDNFGGEDGVIPRVTATEGQAVMLTCDDAPAHAPQGQFKWYKQDKNGGEVVQDNRIAIDQKGTLHFAYVLKSDDLNNQEYKCAISNRNLNIIKLGGPKILEVTRVTPIPESEPVAVFVGTPAVGIINGSVELECIFSGNPVPVITWTDNLQKPVFGGTGRFEFVNDRKILRISKLEENDEGTYTCRGQGFAEKFEEKQIKLDVTSKPIWVQGLRSQTLPATRDAIFRCNARSAKGEPELAAPAWLENGDKISADKFVSKYEFADDQKTLIVKNVQKPGDVTCFQCIVTNNIGQVFDDGCLDVIDPIIITYRPPAIQEIFKNEMVNLTVTATTDPSMTLQYKWYFNNVSYDIPPFVTYDPVTMVSFINTEDLSDEDYRKINGTYIREIFHKFERMNITMEVLLKEVGIAGPVAAAGTDLWWIALVIGILLLVCVIAIICIVCRRKAQEGVYPLDKKERANDLDPEKDLADSGFHDLSRADYDGPEKKGAPLNFTEEPLSYEDDDSLGEYGEDVGKFNEDGSFIGIYMDKKQPPPVAPKPGNETDI